MSAGDKPSRPPAPAAAPLATTQLSVETVSRFLDNQSKEIEVRAVELAAQQKQHQNAHEYACKALEAQVKDRSEDRVHKRRVARERYIFSSFGIAAFGAFLAYALHLGRDALVIEIIKFAGTFFAGGASGAGYLAWKNRNDKADSDAAK